MLSNLKAIFPPKKETLLLEPYQCECGIHLLPGDARLSTVGHFDLGKQPPLPQYNLPIYLNFVVSKDTGSSFKNNLCFEPVKILPFFRFYLNSTFPQCKNVPVPSFV